MSVSHDNDRATESRGRLLAAAATAFAERGFHATTTRDIAAKAGLSPAALYVHHRSKEELLYLISKQGHEEVLQLVRRAVAAPGDPSERLVRAMRAFATYHAERHTIARIVNYELKALSAEHQEEIQALRDEVKDELTYLIDEGVEEGTFTVAKPQLATQVLLSLGVDVSRWHDPDRPWSAAEVAESVTSPALHVVGCCPG